MFQKPADSQIIPKFNAEEEFQYNQKMKTVSSYWSK